MTKDHGLLKDEVANTGVLVVVNVLMCSSTRQSLPLPDPILHARCRDPPSRRCLSHQIRGAKG